MAVEQQDRDSYTGYLTTGHEWNGIKELNTPVPRPVYFFLAIAVLFSVGYWVLMPAWPLGVTYTKGCSASISATLLRRRCAKRLPIAASGQRRSRPKALPRSSPIRN